MIKTRVEIEQKVEKQYRKATKSKVASLKRLFSIGKTLDTQIKPKKKKKEEKDSNC